MRVSIVLATNSQLQVQMVLRESIMYLQAHVLPCFKDMKTKSVKYSSIPKETRSLRQVAIRPAEFGQLMLATSYKFSTVTMTKFFRVLLTTKATLLLQARKTIRAEFGRT